MNQEELDREYLHSVIAKYRRNRRGSYTYLGEIEVCACNGDPRLGYMLPGTDSETLKEQAKLLDRYYDNPEISMQELFYRGPYSSLKEIPFYTRLRIGLLD